ncbi:AAA family ATPase [Spirochaeta cellobiosiphila]|uniref:AAA family ATPase n=1 Tax=Spirochaeta cellobiosiphila TaxID=504483 RepID=UPI000429CBD2|nr:MoxR family ATPase [Spirochaeta cellobiosiphila]
MKEQLDKLITNVQSLIYIERRKLEYILAAMIAGGHVMLSDSHGVGKTSLVRALAASIQWKEGKGFNRVQCTVDLLPQDILGYTRIAGDNLQMEFHKGPIFAHFLLCDEINLLTPKTQGSFFQAMEEQQVTVEGVTHELENPFFIMSTMNLKGAHLFPLPAPQLDRFMIQLSMGYPSLEDEKKIIHQHGHTKSWADFAPVMNVDELVSIMGKVDEVPLHEDIVDYIARLLQATRQNSRLDTGASPRSGIKISRMARALAIVRGLDYVSIDLIKELASPVLTHRLIPIDPDTKPELVLEEIMSNLKVDPQYSSVVRK